jgi:hypothetical protein
MSINGDAGITTFASGDNRVTNSRFVGNDSRGGDGRGNREPGE